MHVLKTMGTGSMANGLALSMGVARPAPPQGPADSMSRLLGPRGGHPSTVGYGGAPMWSNRICSIRRRRGRGHGGFAAQRSGEASSLGHGASREGPYARSGPEEVQQVRFRNTFLEVAPGPRSVRRTLTDGAEPAGASAAACPISHENTSFAEHTAPPPAPSPPP